MLSCLEQRDSRSSPPREGAPAAGATWHGAGLQRSIEIALRGTRRGIADIVRPIECVARHVRRIGRRSEIVRIGSLRTRLDRLSAASMWLDSSHPSLSARTNAIRPHTNAPLQTFGLESISLREQIQTRLDPARVRNRSGVATHSSERRFPNGFPRETRN